MQTRHHELCLLLVKWVREHSVPQKDDRAFHQVLQFANVARPRIPLEGSHGFRGNAVDLLPHAAAKHLHEMRDKSRNVFPALSEGRQQEGENIQTIIQVTAKLPASDHLREISIRCGHQSDIYFMSSTAAQSLELLFLQHTQQFRLQGRGDVTYLVQEQRAFVGHFEAPDLLSDGTGKSTLLM